VEFETNTIANHSSLAVAGELPAPGSRFTCSEFEVMHRLKPTRVPEGMEKMETWSTQRNEIFHVIWIIPLLWWYIEPLTR
jgi:hypothetical protein